MSFIPPMDDWVRSHFVDVAAQTTAILGDLTGKRLLDVGCGDALTAFGLLNAGAREVVGLDVKSTSDEHVEFTIARLEQNGFTQARSLKPRLKLITYDGITAPLESESFDVVFSWGVFEHITNVKAVLLEMKRLMKPDAIGLIKVFPWYQSLYGSHLSDFHAPFAHLTASEAALRAEVVAGVEAKPDAPRDLVLNHVWSEYLTLNKYSADMFFEDFKACGFSSHSWTLLSYPQDLSAAPPGFSLSDLMVCGSDVVFRK